MDKISYVSCPNYFDRLRCKAREIDEGIDRLEETWKASYLLIGGFAECTVESTGYLEEQWQSIRGTNDAVEKFQSELESSQQLEKTDDFLEDSKALLDNLKEECDDISIVLSEYGIHYEEENDNAQDSNRNDSKEQTNSSLVANEDMSDLEVEFTPNLTWKCKTKSKRSDVSNPSEPNSAIKGIATPVIKSLESVRSNWKLPAQRDD